MTLLEKYPEFNGKVDLINELVTWRTVEEILDKHFIRKEVLEQLEHDLEYSYEATHIEKQKVKDAIEKNINNVTTMYDWKKCKLNILKELGLE